MPSTYRCRRRRSSSRRRRHNTATTYVLPNVGIDLLNETLVLRDAGQGAYVEARLGRQRLQQVVGALRGDALHFQVTRRQVDRLYLHRPYFQPATGEKRLGCEMSFYVRLGDIETKGSVTKISVADRLYMGDLYE